MFNIFLICKTHVWHLQKSLNVAYKYKKMCENLDYAEKTSKIISKQDPKIHKTLLLHCLYV